MTGCDTGEQLAGLSAKLSGAVLHISAPPQPKIHTAVPGALQGSRGVSEAVLSLLTSCSGGPFPPFYVRGTESQPGTGWNRAKAQQSGCVLVPGPQKVLSKDLLAKEINPFDPGLSHSLAENLVFIPLKRGNTPPPQVGCCRDQVRNHF